MYYALPVLISALLLGFYDVAKKHAVNHNVVMTTLLLTTLTGSVFFCLIALLRSGWQIVTALDMIGYLQVLFKSLLVAGSWTCVYYALRDLPISIVSPIRSSSPLWTCLGGIILYRETPGAVQALGMITIFAGYYFFSVLGKLEGFVWNSRGMILLILGTILGASSAIFDKYLLNVVKMDAQVMQFHFSVDLAVLLFLAWAVRKVFLKTPGAEFVWRWSIPLTGLLLIAGDFVYFYALSLPDTPISQVSLIRRCNCIVGFALGAAMFRDKNVKRKSLALAVILIGVFLLMVKI